VTEFLCADCDITVYAAALTAPPPDRLCAECRVIREAAPEDRAELARIFGKPTLPAGASLPSTPR
jgi:hypothetical protein